MANRSLAQKMMIALLAILVVGCTELGPLSDIPRPYQPSGKGRSNIGQLAMPNHIVIGPIEGLSTTTSDALRQQLAKALVKRDVLATRIAPIQRTSLLIGQIIQQPSPHIEWQLLDPYGAQRAHLTVAISPDLLLAGEITDPILSQAIKQSATTASEMILAQITGQQRPQPQIQTIPTETAAAPSYIAPPQPLRPKRQPTQANLPTIFLLPFLGAPGNGNAELAAGIRHSLSVQGVPLTTTPGQESLQLQCIVITGPPRNGTEAIAITWELKTPAGKIVASVDQKNNVPAGSLDGVWGETADLITHSAAQELTAFLTQGLVEAR